MIPSSNGRPATAVVTRVTGGVSDDTPPLHSLVTDFVRRWHAGERPLVEDLLADHPSLEEQPIFLRLIQEEHRLRHQFGEPLPQEEFLRRFPRWAAELAILLEPITVRESGQETASPCAGEKLGEFELLAELGRGAEGVVFVARQAALADRPAVLKITSCRGQEHLSLARLQHTNIVPLYSVQQDNARGLRILVMPYFGGTTLAEVLDVLRPIPCAERTGRQIIDVLDQVEARSAVRCAVQGPARLLLARLSYTRALCWIGAALADALESAHQHGLIHLDVKPSNVLVANDGQPMLLDFHLARPPIRPEESIPTIVGGTLAYMPREQHEAMAAVRERRPTKLPLDGRADIYALGATLYHALGGPLPYLQGDSPPLHTINPDVSVGLSDIITRALAAQAKDRYADATALAADLRRHLADQPLVGVANRSVKERWQKWRKRRPYSFILLSMLLAVVGATLAVGLITWQRLHDRRQLAEAALSESRQHLEKKQPALARQSLRRALELLGGQPFQSTLRDEIRGETQRVAEYELTQRRSEAADGLRSALAQIRFLYGSDVASGPPIEKLRVYCRRSWNQRHLLLNISTLGKAAREDLFDLAILLADLDVRLASEATRRQAHKQALHLLNEAEQLLGPGLVLLRERQRHALELGLWEVAERAGQQAQQTPAKTAWEHYALARLLMRQPPLLTYGGSEVTSSTFLLAGLNESMMAYHLDQACALDPGGFWPSFVRGQHSYRQGQYSDAVAAFSVCIGSSPREPACLVNRALAHAALGRESAALRDVASAGQLDQTLTRRRAQVHYNLAVFALGRDDRSTARRHLEESCKVDQHHTASQFLLRRLAAP